MTATQFHEEYGLLPGARVPTDPDAQRAYEAKVAEAVESELNGAVGRGAIRSGERDRWRSRLQREPNLGTDILRELPGDPALAARNFEEDGRIRDLDQQWAAHSGIERTVEHQADEDLSGEERTTRAFLRVLKPGATR